MKMTGWEVEGEGTFIFDYKKKEIEDLLEHYPLCALGRKEEEFLIIRKCHPTLELPPEDRGDFRYCLVCYFTSGICYYALPTYTFLKLNIKNRDNGYLQIIITSEEKGSVSTNINELGRKLLYGVKTEELKVEGFASLVDDIVIRKKTPILETEIKSSVLGTMMQTEFDDWWVSEPISIPCWEGIKTPITFLNLTPADDTDFISVTDLAMNNFLKITNQERIKGATIHVYNNCIEFVDSVFDETDEEYSLYKNMNSIQDVWKYVTLSNIYVERASEDGKVYMCACEWEKEHSLQLIYDESAQLFRVSEQDGNIYG